MFRIQLPKSTHIQVSREAETVCGSVSVRTSKQSCSFAEQERDPSVCKTQPALNNKHFLSDVQEKPAGLIVLKWN